MSTTTDRGYGADHQAERERWAQIIAVQDVACTMPVCKKPTRTIPAGSPGHAWDLNHTADRTGWTGPAHRYCNRWASTHPLEAKAEPASRDW